MSVTELRAPIGSASEISLTTPSDRRSDVDEKQARIGALLSEVGCDGLLVLLPENFAWLSAGGSARGVIDQAALPALYYSPDGRWVLSSNVDSQRLFDEELDSMGFQLKEWTWYTGREGFLTDLCQGRNVACDVPFGDCRDVSRELRRMRLALSEYERACYRALGQILAHALEATGRNIVTGETEREVAGQVAHRLFLRGAWPVMFTVAADGRTRPFRQGSFSSTPVLNYCVVTTTAR